MKKTETTILIVASVGVHAMDGVLKLARQRWPTENLLVVADECTFTDLSRDERIDVLERWRELDGFGGGRGWRVPNRVEAVLVPFYNSTGAGYEAVFRSLRRVAARAWFAVDCAQRLREVRREEWLLSMRRERVVRLLLAPITLLLAGLFFRRDSAVSFRM